MSNSRAKGLISAIIATNQHNDLHGKCKKVKALVFHPMKVYKWSKAIPVQAWTGPEGSRSLRLPDFKTVDT